MAVSIRVACAVKKVVGQFEAEMMEWAEKGDYSLTNAEKLFPCALNRVAINLLNAVYEALDADLLSAKANRRKEGLSVQRRYDRRRILTRFGELEFQRTYYKGRDGSYCYPVDNVVEIVHHQKVSDSLCQDLATAACTMSYARSSETVTGGQVSRKTVMNAVRRCVPVTEEPRRRRVPVLHVDADEDHIKLQSGRSSIVPLICVYEGIEKHGKRGVCKNIFSRASFGKGTESLWEEVLTEMEHRYDLDGTVIYLHGDGAAWIKKGLEWLPNSIFVLDRFHKNKAFKNAVSGIEQKVGRQYERVLRQALNASDLDLFSDATNSLIDQYPDRTESIRQNTNYLLDNLDAIQICNSDPEAKKGGATEPHVSHILSSRLSSRPMGWSKETLERFVPILAAGSCALEPRWTAEIKEAAPTRGEIRKSRKKPKYTMGLYDPALHRVPRGF